MTSARSSDTGSPGHRDAPPGLTDPTAVLRSKQYLTALLLAALLGVPISVVAYGFLALVSTVQRLLFIELPSLLLGSSAPPAWWPVPILGVAGLLTALAISRLPGPGGHSPALGFQTGGGPPSGRDLPGVAAAAFATLAFGAVLGPEAPLIAIGGGLAAMTARRMQRDATPQAVTVMGSAGSFAAISTLMGSPLLAAFLIMESAGIGGITLVVVALPGLLAAGVGALVFSGLGSWTGLGAFSLSLPSVPAAEPPTLLGLGWAVVIGAAGAGLGWLIRRVALALRPLVHRQRLAATTLLGLAVGTIAMTYQLLTTHSFTEILFSGQETLPTLVGEPGGFATPALALLIIGKALAYALSLSAFRGGPVFPAMMVGAALGLLVSGLPGLDAAAAIGMGIGALAAAMLRLPLTAALLATVLMGADGVVITPQVVVAVSVAFLVTVRLPAPREPDEADR